MKTGILTELDKHGLLLCISEEDVYLYDSIKELISSVNSFEDLKKTIDKREQSDSLSEQTAALIAEDALSRYFMLIDNLHVKNVRERTLYAYNIEIFKKHYKEILNVTKEGLPDLIAKLKDQVDGKHDHHGEYFAYKALVSALQCAFNEYKNELLSKEYERVQFIIKEIDVVYPDQTKYSYHKPRLFKYRELMQMIAPEVKESAFNTPYDNNTVTIESMFGLDDDNLALVNQTISFYDLMIFLDGKVSVKKR